MKLFQLMVEHTPDEENIDWTKIEPSVNFLKSPKGVCVRPLPAWAWAAWHRAEASVGRRPWSLCLYQIWLRLWPRFLGQQIAAIELIRELWPAKPQGPVCQCG